MKAYQDEIKWFEDFHLFERMNILYDQRAKEIIRKEIKSKIPFPFKLSSFFISLTTSNLIVNMKEDL